MRLCIREISEVVPKLPRFREVAEAGKPPERPDELFIAALGFEDRCLAWPRRLAGASYSARRALYCQYKTNRSDNEVNLPELQESLESVSDEVTSLGADSPRFTTKLLGEIDKLDRGNGPPSVSVDVSVMANRLMSRCLKVLLESDINLTILYSEAAIYHPTKEEFVNSPKHWTTGPALERGVGDVVTSIDHPGNHLDVLPNTVILFPSFKLDRSRAVLAKIDPSLLATPDNRVIWIVGVPRLEEDAWRTEAMKQLNEISEDDTVYEVSTFDYRETLRTLQRIWQDRATSSNLSLSPLGSKLQGIGIALFCLMHPDVRIEYASPREYNAALYSEGCKSQWVLEIGETAALRRLLEEVGRLDLER